MQNNNFTKRKRVLVSFEVCCVELAGLAEVQLVRELPNKTSGELK